MFYLFSVLFTLAIYFFLNWVFYFPEWLRGSILIVISVLFAFFTYSHLYKESKKHKEADKDIESIVIESGLTVASDALLILLIFLAGKGVEGWFGRILTISQGWQFCEKEHLLGGLSFLGCLVIIVIELLFAGIIFCPDDID